MDLRPLVALAVGVIAMATATISGWPPPPNGQSPEQPLSVLPKMITINASQELSVDTLIRLKTGGRLRAWFTLAVPGTLEPWRHFEYKSAVFELDTIPNKSEVVTWHERLRVRDGSYQPNFWFEQLTADGWESAGGGTYGTRLITLRGLGSQFQQLYGGAVADVSISQLSSHGSAIRFTLSITGSTTSTPLSARWELRDGLRPDQSPVFESTTLEFSNEASFTALLDVDEELFVPPGDYDLWVTVRGGDATQSQLVRLRHAYVQGVIPPFERAQKTLGPFAWNVQVSPALLRGGATTVLDAKVLGTASEFTCRAFWKLTDASANVVATGSTGCDNPAILAPVVAAEGRYFLTLSAYSASADGSSGSLSDTIRWSLSVVN